MFRHLLSIGEIPNSKALLGEYNAFCREETSTKKFFGIPSL
jgi:hypothetical protein